MNINTVLSHTYAHAAARHVLAGGKGEDGAHRFAATSRTAVTPVAILGARAVTRMGGGDGAALMATPTPAVPRR